MGPAAFVLLSFGFDVTTGAQQMIVYLQTSYAGDGIPTDPDPDNEAYHPETQNICLPAIRIPRDSPPSRVAQVVADAVGEYAKSKWGVTVPYPQILMTGLMTKA